MHARIADQAVQCALIQEQRYLSGEEGGWRAGRPEVGGVVWMVITDSPAVKRRVVNLHGGEKVRVGAEVGFEAQVEEESGTGTGTGTGTGAGVGPLAYDGDGPSAAPYSPNEAGSRTVPRTVLTTNSKGAHTRPKGGDHRDVESATADFAEALVDWWLLGETDLVVASREHSFGALAAMRTARPIYHRVLGRNEKGNFVNSACGRGILADPPNPAVWKKDGSEQQPS